MNEVNLPSESEGGEANVRDVLVDCVEFAVSFLQVNVTFRELEEDICDVMNKNDHETNLVVPS